MVQGCCRRAELVFSIPKVTGIDRAGFMPCATYGYLRVEEAISQPQRNKSNSACGHLTFGAPQLDYPFGAYYRANAQPLRQLVSDIYRAAWERSSGGQPYIPSISGRHFR